MPSPFLLIFKYVANICFVPFCRVEFDLKPCMHTFQFADIVGFTAWYVNHIICAMHGTVVNIALTHPLPNGHSRLRSSAREPNQVLTLLEVVFSAFDEIAARRGVFKVETVGDCYVAVTGVPTARTDHACKCFLFSRSKKTRIAEANSHLTLLQC